MAGVKQGAAPENPFGDGAGQVALIAPYHPQGLAAELSAAVPGAATALRGPARPEEPVSAANPAWLAFTGEGVSEKTVRGVVAAHDPAAAGDAARNIRGSEVAKGLSDLRELLSAGEVLDAIGCSNAIALLLGVSPPGPPSAAQK